MSLRSLSLNQKLAVAALVLGALALFGDPGRGDRVIVDVQDLAWSAAGGGDRIAVGQVADWLIQGRSDFRIFDLQDAEGYAAYHLPGAENVALVDLHDPPALRSERILVMAQDAARAVEGWTLLRAQGYRAYLVDGGLDAWKDEVLFPRLPEEAPPEMASLLAQRAEVARFFGGQPRGGGAELDAPALELPTVAAPVAPAGAPAKKKKKEGC